MSKSILSEWLEKIQQESWQLELLISGFAIFGLFEFKDFFDDYVLQLASTAQLSTALMLGFAAIIYGFITIFLTNLLIHVFIRGLWIGAIGLRYVSGDINFEELNYSSRFTKYFKSRITSFDQYIESLERLSSVIFSYTYLLFFIFFSSFFFILTLMVLTIAVALWSGGIDWSGYSIGFQIGSTFLGKFWMVFVLFHLFLAAIVSIDFLLLGYLKKIENRFFSSIYLFIYKYMGLITLSIFWRPLLLNFLDTKFTKILYILAIPYIFLTFFFIPSFEIVSSEYFPDLDMDIEFFGPQKLAVSANAFLPGYYDDEVLRHKELPPDFFTIPSKIVRGDLFEVFIKEHMTDNKYIASKNKSISKLNESGLFTFFNSSEDEEQIEYEHKRDSIKSKYDPTGLDSLSKDSLRKIRYIDLDNYDRKFNAEKTEYHLTNLEKIKEAIKSSFIFEVDKKTLDPSSVFCDYYIHPQHQIQGYLCYFKIDSLISGRHHFSFSKITIEGHGRMKEIDYDTTKVTIPFIYSNN